MVNEIIKEKHNNEETALVVNNYPYGFRLRTKIRYWIETDKKKGDRFISQTLNPKTNLWNNPKKSVYNSVMVLNKDTETGYIHYFGLYSTTDKERIEQFLKNIDGYELNLEQKEQIKILNAYSKAYENVSFEISPVPYNRTEEEQKKINEEQEKVKTNINKMVNYYYKNETK